MVLEKEEDIVEAFHNYFSKLFSYSTPTKEDTEQCTHVLEPEVKEMNAILTKRCTREEVSEVLK